MAKKTLKSTSLPGNKKKSGSTAIKKKSAKKIGGDGASLKVPGKKSAKASLNGKPSLNGSHKKGSNSKNGNGDSVDHLKAFETHGVEFHRQDGHEHKAICPFDDCQKDAFTVNDEEGLWRCWDCGRSGNKYTFLQLFYEMHFKATKLKEIKALAKLRSLPEEVFQMAEIAYDSNKRRWLVPVRNEKGSMVNLRHWDPAGGVGDKKPYFMNTASCKTHLYNLDRIANASTIYVCEGEWDCMAMEWLLLHSKTKDAASIAVPGVDTFKEEWAEIFNDKIVVLLYDKDEAGERGMQKAADILRAHTRCRELHQIKWPDSFPEKFDVSDYIRKNLSKPKRAYAELRKTLISLPLHDKKSVGIVRTSFDQVVKDFRKHIYLSDDMKDAMLLIFAVILSNRVFPDPYCPLWLFLVAPPGGGKTMLLQAAGDTDEVQFISTMTPKTLISGFKTHDGEDLSLLPRIIGKTLIVKDWTTIMNLSSGEQDEIYSVMRDAYDGRVEKSFGHIKGMRIYPEPGSEHKTCHFTFLAGVTGQVHADRRANHGERFLKYQMMAPSGRDAINQIRAAIDNTVEAATPETLLRESASSFIEHKFDSGRLLAKVPEWVIERVIGLGQIVSTVRAVVLRKQGELVVRPESEVASRISKQLIKLGQAVAFVLDKDSIDEEVYRIMQRVGLDTCYGWHRDILMSVASAGPKGLLRDEIIAKAQVASSTTQRCLEDLFELRALEYVPETEANTGQRQRPGKPKFRWHVSAFMQELFDRAKIDSLLKKRVKREISDRRRAKKASRKKVLSASTRSSRKHSSPRKKKKVAR